MIRKFNTRSGVFFSTPNKFLRKSELWIAKDFPAIPFCAGFHHSVLVSRQEAAAEHTGHAQKGDKLWGWNVLSPAKGSGTFREWKQFTPGWTQNLHRSVGACVGSENTYFHPNSTLNLPTKQNWDQVEEIFFGFHLPQNLRNLQNRKHSKRKAPPAGLEPATTRLRALRSTDWAREAHIHLNQRIIVGGGHAEKSLVLNLTTPEKKKEGKTIRPV